MAVTGTLSLLNVGNGVIPTTTLHPPQISSDDALAKFLEGTDKVQVVRNFYKKYLENAKLSLAPLEVADIAVSKVLELNNVPEAVGKDNLLAAVYLFAYFESYMEVNRTPISLVRYEVKAMRDIDDAVKEMTLAALELSERIKQHNPAADDAIDVVNRFLIPDMYGFKQWSRFFIPKQDTAYNIELPKIQAVWLTSALAVAELEVMNREGLLLTLDDNSRGLKESNLPKLERIGHVYATISEAFGAADLTSGIKQGLVQISNPEGHKAAHLAKTKVLAQFLERLPGNANDGDVEKLLDQFDTLEQEAKEKLSSKYKGLVDLILEAAKAPVMNGGLGLAPWDVERISFDVEVRVKTTASMLEKLARKPDQYKNFSDLFDIIATRIIVGYRTETGQLDEHQALRIAEFVRDKLEQDWYAPEDVRHSDDYVKSPTKTGYRAYHLDLACGTHNEEVQIRTTAMHDAAEYGIASHAAYRSKDGRMIPVSKTVANALGEAREASRAMTTIYLIPPFLGREEEVLLFKVAPNATIADAALEIVNQLPEGMAGRIPGLSEVLRAGRNKASDPNKKAVELVAPVFGDKIVVRSISGNEDDAHRSYGPRSTIGEGKVICIDPTIFSALMRQRERMNNSGQARVVSVFRAGADRVK